LSLTEIAKVNDVALAQILRGRLLSEGIEAILFDANLSGLLGGGFPGIRLMVKEEDAGAARRILDLPEKEAND
jgi:hypothetical protein